MSAGKTILILGLVLAGVGLVLMLGEKLPFRLGRLPGDIEIRGKNWSLYFPLATCAAASVILSLLFWLLGKR